MKYLIPIGLLITGLALGYLLGRNYSAVEVTENTTTKYITEFVHDTVVEMQVVNVPETVSYDTISIQDTLNSGDSSVTLEMLDSLIDESELTINREILKKSAWIKVEVLEELKNQDSLIAEMMNLNQELPDQILIEFWESPLGFSGYKLNRNKLVLYGMPEQTEYRIYRKTDQYYFSTENFYYSISETEDFLPYLEVEKSVLFQ